MKQLLKRIARRREKGQSLVEVAIFFPIFIILLAGLVEVTQIVVDQNRVSNAARVGARFMANGGDDKGMVRVSLNAITQTLVEDPSVWDVWSIRATVNDQGTGFSDWEFEHVYGISATTRFSSVVESQVQADVLAELQTAGNPATADIKLVGTLMVHDFDSILGLDAIPVLGNVNSVRALNVMRMVGFNRDASQGCYAYPIAIEEGIRSVTEGLYPGPSDFGPGSPSPPPEYEFFKNKGHESDIPLLDAPEFGGHVFFVKNGFGSGNFGWLVWNEGRPKDANTLVASLREVNSGDYETHAGGGPGLNPLPPICGDPNITCPADGRFPGYVEAGDHKDDSLNIGDYVAGATGNMNSNDVRAALRNLTTDEIRMIVWNTAENPGANVRYRISRFAVFKIYGFKITGNTNDSWILAEFIHWDDTCGQT